MSDVDAVRGPTAALAAFVAALRFDQLPAVTVDQAKRSILDTLGCVLQGSTLPWCRTMQEVARDEGGAANASAWGTELRTSRSQAAWLNATAGHAFEFDDVHMGGMFHSGSLTLCAAVAAGEHAGLSGRDLIAAVVGGTEVGARVGRAVGTTHFLAGYHPQGTVGVFAAAASAARAIGADPNATLHALGIAGSHAAGLMAAQRGSMVKRLNSGHAAQSGVQAALLAERGFTGIIDVLEVDYGGFTSTMGGGTIDLDQLVAGLGERWETEQIAFKPYPSCAAAQASIEGARLLRLAHSLRAADVREVVVTTTHHVHTHSGWDYRPEGVTAAQMSIGYGVARMLLDGSLEARHFTDAAIADPATLDVCSRIRVVADPRLDALGPDRRYVCSVDIDTAHAGIVHVDVDDRPGNASNPLTDDQLMAKFTSLATPVIGAAAQRVAALVQRLDDVADVRELTSLLQPEVAA